MHVFVFIEIEAGGRGAWQRLTTLGEGRVAPFLGPKNNKEGIKNQRSSVQNLAPRCSPGTISPGSASVTSVSRQSEMMGGRARRGLRA